jgi:hypothetical protein
MLFDQYRFFDPPFEAVKVTPVRSTPSRIFAKNSIFTLHAKPAPRLQNNAASDRTTDSACNAAACEMAEHCVHGKTAAAAQHES